MTTSQRILQLAKKMDSANKLLEIAKVGLSSANRGNPFITKSDAMARINSVRNYQRQLSVAKILNDRLFGVGA